MVNRTRMAALSDYEAQAGQHDHQVDEPQDRRRPVPAGEETQRAGLAGEGADAVAADGECCRAHHQQVEDARHDDDADDAGRHGAPGIPRLLAQCRRRLEAGEGGDAVDHRVGDVARALVRR
jgi:hypothetical protein